MSSTSPYGALIAKIVEHPRYGPAMEDAVQRRAPLVLNYHSHRGDDRYCVSVCERLEGAIELLDVGIGDLRELVHVEGFGRGSESCLPLCSELGRALQDHYGLARAPLIYRDGEPLRPTDGPPPANGGGER